MGGKERINENNFFACFWVRLDDAVPDGWILCKRGFQSLATTGLRKALLETARKIVNRDQRL